MLQRYIFSLKYEERLGQTKKVTGLSKVSPLFTIHPHLALLEELFSHKEIDDIVVDFPLHKKDFYDLCDEFHQGALCLKVLIVALLHLYPKRRMPPMYMISSQFLY
jgi:hypothetical protein